MILLDFTHFLLMELYMQKDGHIRKDGGKHYLASTVVWGIVIPSPQYQIPAFYGPNDVVSLCHPLYAL